MKIPGKNIACVGIALQIGLFYVIFWLYEGVFLIAWANSTYVSITERISYAVWATFPIGVCLGILSSLLGGILALIALVICQYRPRWFGILLWILAMVWILFVPFLTLLGIVSIYYLAKYDIEFLVNKRVSS